MSEKRRNEGNEGRGRKKQRKEARKEEGKKEASKEGRNERTNERRQEKRKEERKKGIKERRGRKQKRKNKYNFCIFLLTFLNSNIKRLQKILLLQMDTLEWCQGLKILR